MSSLDVLFTMNLRTLFAFHFEKLLMRASLYDTRSRPLWPPPPLPRRSEH